MTIIYGIFNKTNLCVYVGSTTNLSARKATHKYHARIYNKLPIHHFINENDYYFKVLKTVKDEERYIEEYFITKEYKGLLNVNTGTKIAESIKQSWSESRREPFIAVEAYSNNYSKVYYSREQLEKDDLVYGAVMRVLKTKRETYNKLKWRYYE